MRVDGAVGAAGVVWRPSPQDGQPPQMRAARHPDSLGAVLAELVGLGPRPTGFAGDARSALTWPEVEAIARRGTLHIVLWRSAHESAERTALVVVDLEGFALVLPAGEPRRYRVQPVSLPVLWASLCSLIGRLDPASASEPDRSQPWDPVVGDGGDPTPRAHPSY